MILAKTAGLLTCLPYFTSSLRVEFDYVEHHKFSRSIDVWLFGDKRGINIYENGMKGTTEGGSTGVVTQLVMSDKRK